MEEKSYLERRVYDLYGLTEEQCSVPLWRGKRPARPKKRQWTDEATGERKEEWMRDEEENFIADPFPLFQTDDRDNIRIFPYTLDGQLITYLRDKQPKYGEGDVEDTYFITRMNPEWLKDNPGQPKYRFPGAYRNCHSY